MRSFSAAAPAASVSRLAIVVVMSAAVLTLASFSGRSSAHAAGKLVDAMVVPGYGPSSPQPPAAYAAPPVSGYVSQPAPSYPVQGRGRYGGGFIEMLMDGGGPSPMPPAVLYNRPGAALAPSSRNYVAYAQPSQPAYEARRTVDPQYLRAEIDYPTSQPAGTIIVDTPSKHLYLVQGGGRALRYGIGVGRPGFTWSGVKSVTRKAEWPDWTPPAEMLLRRPDLPRHMAGGPENPLGARALYLGSSLYRIHGTNEPYTIGQNVSSGCIRMMNEDVTDLYGRVRVGTKVVVM